METSAALLVTLNDLLVCLLPAVFFRRDGRPTPLWLLTALPYALAPAVTWLVYDGALQPPLGYQPLPALLGVALSALSIAMIAQAMGTHRVPLALWHQPPEREVPREVVNWGIYRRIRHPFYSAFILLMLANMLITQHPFALVLLAYVSVMLFFTARKEEHRLAAQPDPIGPAYRRYMHQSWRFFPFCGGRAR